LSTNGIIKFSGGLDGTSRLTDTHAATCPVVKRKAIFIGKLLGRGPVRLPTT